MQNTYIKKGANDHPLICFFGEWKSLEVTEATMRLEQENLLYNENILARNETEYFLFKNYYSNKNFTI